MKAGKSLTSCRSSTWSIFAQCPKEEEKMGYSAERATYSVGRGMRSIPALCLSWPGRKILRPRRTDSNPESFPRRSPLFRLSCASPSLNDLSSRRGSRNVFFLSQTTMCFVSRRTPSFDAMSRHEEISCKCLDFFSRWSVARMPEEHASAVLPKSPLLSVSPR
jgi:hypothetical protein